MTEEVFTHLETNPTHVVYRQTLAFVKVVVTVTMEQLDAWLGKKTSSHLGHIPES